MKENQPIIILFVNMAPIFTSTVHNIRAEAQGKQACSRRTLAVVVGSFEKKEPSLQKLLLNSLSKLIGLIAR